MAMARSSSTTAATGKGTTVVDEVFRGQHPRLHEFLTEVVWDDQKPRKTGTLMIVVEDGWWKAWLHDRDGKGSAWFTSGSVLDVLTAVEMALEDGNVAWRADRR